MRNWRAPLWVVVTVAAVALGGALPFLWQRYAPFDKAGSTSVSAVQGAPVGNPVRAKPAPATRPAPVAAPGACGAAMASIRLLQRAYPSGAMLREGANRRLTIALVRLHRECTATPALEQAFRTRELTPWLTYLPPGAAPG